MCAAPLATFTERYNPLEWPFCAKGRAVTMADTLNVRAEPSVEAGIVGKFARDTRVIVWASLGDWYLVQDVTGVTGWCSSVWLRVEGELIA